LEASRDTPSADWFEGPLGARVLREEAALAPLALDDVFGFELLQVGAWGAARHLLDGARTQHTTLVAPEMSPGVTLCAPLDSLPFRSDSIDGIFLPHTLELMEDPYAVLREAERVLVAEGCLMICGFNPFSGWGVRRAFAQYFGRPVFPPQTRRLLSERRLRLRRRSGIAGRSRGRSGLASAGICGRSGLPKSSRGVRDTISHRSCRRCFETSVPERRRYGSTTVT